MKGQSSHKGCCLVIFEEFWAWGFGVGKVWNFRIIYRIEIIGMLGLTERRNYQNNQGSEKEVSMLMNLQAQELNCQKQIHRLYGKLSKVFERGVSLEIRKSQLQSTKLHLASIENESERDLSKQLLALKQAFKTSEAEHSNLKKDLISNSMKIKETCKQIKDFKDQIAQKQQIHSRMKRQTQTIRQRQLESLAMLTQLQARIKEQSLKKISHLQQQKHPEQDSQKTELLRKIGEMKQINELLTSILNQ